MEVKSAAVRDELSIIKHLKNSPFYLIFSIDRDGNILAWNEAAKKVSGYSEEDVLGKHFSIFCRDEDVKESYAAINTALEKGFSEKTGWRVKKTGMCFGQAKLSLVLMGKFL